MDTAEHCPKCDKSMTIFKLFEDQPIQLHCSHNLCFSCCCLNNQPQDELKIICPTCNENSKPECEKDEKKIQFYIKNKPQKIPELLCEKHENEDCTIYCRYCDELVCNQCICDHSEHLNHFLKGTKEHINDMFEKVHLLLLENT